MAGESFNIEHLAIPAVSALIIFLSYSSQLLFLFLEPGPLSRAEAWKFNVLVASIWICYYRACTVDPGRVPKGWEARKNADKDESSREKEEDVSTRQRWCRKCSALKPPRAHHCKKCQRCVPKMDHHCPWTCNCVSHFTFPHFVRFLFYAVVSIIYLESFIFTRIGIIWDQRSLPSYLGPSIPALAHLFILVVTNSLTLFALGILLVRTLWSLGANVTTIESWEIERHSTLVHRARYFGGQLDGPDGIKIIIKKQEFPYDIGIFQNIRDGMGGSSNILSWFSPFAATPDKNSGLDFEVNGFEDPNLSWPPPDPDRIPRRLHPINATTDPFTVPRFRSTSDEIEAFKQRQEEDMARRGGLDDFATIRRRKKFHERHETRRRAGQNEVEDEEDEDEERLEDDDGGDGNSDAYDYIEVDEGEEAWRDSDGQRLGDYGVDEEVEFYDEDDVPLSVVRERIKAGV